MFINSALEHRLTLWMPVLDVGGYILSSPRTVFTKSQK